jgi:hypothetical protein
MRRRIFFGSLVSTLVAGGTGFLLAEAGVSALTRSLVVALLFVMLTSAHAIAVLNGLLRDLERIEEAALRASFGELGVRVGKVPPPYDGLAHRMDQVFGLLDEASPDATPGPE